MKRHLSAPRVWDSKGREIFPRNGAIVPAGSIMQDGDSFIDLPESIWVLEDNVNDMGYRNAPNYAVRQLVK